jgi:hypothetical protein
MKLEELTKGSLIKGILPNQIITVIDVKWCGSNAVELTYNPHSALQNVVHIQVS